jgi:hypothetical protein
MMSMATPAGHSSLRSQGLIEELPADEHAADLTGAGAYLVQLGIPEQPAGGVVVDVAVAAQNLDGIQRHLCSPLSGVQDDGSAGLAAGAACGQGQVAGSGAGGEVYWRSGGAGQGAEL